MQEYVLLACQDTSGGLRDKPSRFKDLYHTAYCLGGISIAQNNFNGPPSLIGLSTNHLLPLNYAHNITKQNCEKAIQYFEKLPKYKDL